MTHGKNWAGRALDIPTLDRGGSEWARQFNHPTAMSRSFKDVAVAGQEWVMQCLFNMHFMDEFEYLFEKIRAHLSGAELTEFNKIAKDRFAPRDEELHAHELAERLAIFPDGEHIDGKIGTVQLGNRVVGKRLKNKTGASGRVYEFIKNVYWPIYAGEGHERAIGSSIVDAIPAGAEPLAVGALNTRISNEVALLMCDSCVDNLDEGSVGAVIEGRSGSQPADPDTVVSGTLLFALNANTATTFGAAADAAPGGTATAGTIDDDTSANATGTLGYCRASSANSADTPLDDHIDGEAGTSGADFNFNTLAITSGSTVSLTSWTVTQPET